MTIPNTSNSYVTAFGTSSNGIAVPVFQNRAPTPFDTNYPLGKRWIDPANNSAYELTSFGGNPVLATWVLLGSSGLLNTINGVLPAAGNINLVDYF